MKRNKYTKEFEKYVRENVSKYKREEVKHTNNNMIDLSLNIIAISVIRID